MLSVDRSFLEYTTNLPRSQRGAVSLEERAPWLAYIREIVDLRYDQSKEDYGPGFFSPAPSATYSAWV